MATALDLARRYTEALSALRAIHVFDAWLGNHWHEHCPAPGAAAASHTPLGVAGTISWHETGEQVTGILPGQEGCFRIPRAEPLPDFPSAAISSTNPPDEDMVVSAAMQEALPSPER